MLTSKNKWKMGKKALCLVFALIFSIESFAAVVSDNDGSAFITKAEFDSLKNLFQAQIDNYYTQIDAKIDDAIARYLIGIKVARKITPDALFNKLTEERRTFTNSWSNPTTSTQDDLYIQIAKNVINIYVRGAFIGKTGSTGSLTCYMLNTLSGSHAKWRAPVNNGGTGRYLLTKKYDRGDGGFYVEDVGLYDVDQVIEISGGQTADSQCLNYNWFNAVMDPSLDFSSKITDSIWTQNFLVGYLYRVPILANGSPDPTDFVSRGMAGRIPPASKILDQESVSVNAMCSICVMESNVGDVNNLETMSSGSVWTTNTGTIQQDGVHDWKYKYENVALAGAGAQAFGGIFYWNPTAVNPTTGAATGYRQLLNQNIANDYRTEYEPITFMGPKVEMIKGNDFVVKDVSDLVDKSLHYYSGLPLFKMSMDGKVSLKLRLSFTNRNDTVIAVRDEPFDNTSISTRSSKDIYWKRWSSADLATGEVTINIPATDLSTSRDKILYIKLYNTASASGSDVTVYAEECSIEEEL